MCYPLHTQDSIATLFVFTNALTNSHKLLSSKIGFHNWTFTFIVAYMHMTNHVFSTFCICKNQQHCRKGKSNNKTHTHTHTCTLLPHAHDPIMYSARFVCARINNTVEKGNLRTKHTHTRVHYATCTWPNHVFSTFCMCKNQQHCRKGKSKNKTHTHMYINATCTWPNHVFSMFCMCKNRQHCRKGNLRTTHTHVHKWNNVCVVLYTGIIATVALA